jgi:peptidyl-prolyl cis-trans isomerase A (cyclophilin A)
MSLTALAAVVALMLSVVSGPVLDAQGPRGKAALMNPAELKEQAPATFRVLFDTSAGPFELEVVRDWAPIGVDRFYNLVKRGFYDENRFYRVMPEYMAQLGIHGDIALCHVGIFLFK